MRIGIGRLLVVAAVCCAMLVLAGSAAAARFSGVVVHQNARAHSFVVAVRGGSMKAVHSTHWPKLGSQVTVSVRRLRNGTWQAQHITVGHGVSRHVRIRGTVTHVDLARGLYVVSGRGVSLVVRRRGHHGARTSSALRLSVGEIVTVDGTLSGDGVDESQVQSDGQDTNGIDLEGRVMAIDTVARTLSISADDEDSLNQALTVTVPASFDISLFSVGQEVELIVSPNPDGTYTLEQSSNDGGASHADNPGDNQGDGGGDQHASAEQLCSAQQSDPNFASTHNGLSFTNFWETDPNEPNDAFGRCVDGMAHGTPSNPSPELQCHSEHSDPNFPASHNGQSFAQFYNPQDPANLNDAYGRCIDSKASSQEGSGGGSGSGGNGGDGGTTGPTGPSGID